MLPIITNLQIETLLAVVRLGDADRLGWWRSHSVDETGEYVLAQAFPNTWMATAVELAMESARIRHNMALERHTAIHLFSDYLPFHRELTAWLIQQKLDKDFESLSWLPDASIEELRSRLETPVAGEQRGDVIYLGEITQGSLGDRDALQGYLTRLSSAYADLDDRFAAPYMDLA